MACHEVAAHGLHAGLARYGACGVLDMEVGAQTTILRSGYSSSSR